MDFVKIRIGSELDGSGFANAEKAFGGLDGKAQEFFNTLKAGVGIDVGGRIVASIAAIPAAFEGAIRRGVEFNVKMNDAELAIGQVLQKFSGLNAVAAKNEAAKAMAQIAELEPKTAATLDGLVQGFMATLAASQSAGISVQQNIDLVGKFANALANANLPAEQLAQEMRSIMSGNITADSSLAQVLGITNKDVSAAREAGNLFAMLTEKVGTLGEAGDSFAVRWSSLESAIDKSLATMSRPVFDVLFQSLQTLTTELQNPAVVNSFRKLGFEVAHLVEGGAALLSWALKNAPALAALATGASLLGAALAGLALARAVVSLGAWTAGLVASSLATSQAAAATSAETVTLAANTAAQTANAVARGANTAAAGVGGAGRVAAAGAGAAGAGAGAIGLAAAGIPIGASIYAYRTAKAHSDTAAAQVNDALVDSLEKQRGQLVAQLKAATDLESKTAARKALEEQIAAIRAQRAGLDESGQVIAGRGIHNLEKTLAQFDTLAGSQPAAPARLAGAEDDGKKRERTLALRDYLGGLDSERTAEREKEGEGLEKNMAAESERFLKNRETLTDLREQLAIEKEIVRGHDKQAQILEIQRGLRKQIAQIESGELVPADQASAIALANQTAELKTQAALKPDPAKAGQRALTRAEDDVTAAEARGSESATRKAQLALFTLQKKQKLSAEGFDGADLDPADPTGQLGKELASHRQALRKTAGGIDATGQRSVGDSMNGLGTGAARAMSLSRSALDAGYGLPLQGMPEIGRGKTADGDWNNLFHNGLSPLVPAPSNRGPSPQSAHDDTGSPLAQAAKSADGADKSLKEKATAMSKSLDGLKTTATTTLDAISTKMDSFATGLKTLETKVEAMRTE